MGVLPPVILSLIYAFTATTTRSTFVERSSSISLSSEITAKVPTCAQTCFQSFVDTNFPSSVCTSNPTLDCLCTNSSTSRYTIGEGAVQCILSEVNVGFCQGANSSTQVAQDAYNMCAGKVKALPNTHATLTATLIVQSSDPSIVQIAPTPESPSTSLLSSATGIRSTSASPISSTPSTSPSASTSQQTAATISSTATAQATSQTAQPSSTGSGLSASQIAGISVAGVGAAALAVGAIALVACLRRRRMSKRDSIESNNLPFQLGPDIGAVNGFRVPTEKPMGYYGPSRFPTGPNGKMAPRIPPQPLETDPNMFSRRTIQPEEIGVAISPENRHSSKLLPDKPILKLQVPLQPSVSDSVALSFPMPPQDDPPDYRYGHGRESTMTQFEEDSDPYGYGDFYGIYGSDRRSTEAILPQGAPGGYQPQIPKILLPEDSYVRPLKIAKTQQTFSQPLRPNTAGSSIYSARGSLPPSDNGHDNTGGYQWRPPRQQTYKQYTPYRRDRESEGSITSIDTQETTLEADLRASEMRTADLSPVVESPVGRSPVSYPKIPSLSPTNSRGMPLPLSLSRSRQPDFELYRRRSVERSRGPKGQKNYVAPSAVYNSLTPQGKEEPPRSDSALSNSSAASSLLAKRRGDRRAAALKLRAADEEAARRHQAKWRVLKEEQINAAKREDWRPQTGSRRREEEQQRTELPATPTWTPKLTPQKKGGVLYLDVQ